MTIRCPKCGTQLIRTDMGRIKKTIDAAMNQISRPRHCPACDYKTTTVEIELGVLSDLRRRAHMFDRITSHEISEV